MVEVPYLHLQRVSMRAPPRTTNNGLGFRAKTRFQKTKKTSPDLFNQAMVHLLRATKTDALEPGHGALHPMRHNDRNYPPHISQKSLRFVIVRSCFTSCLDKCNDTNSSHGCSSARPIRQFVSIHPCTSGDRKTRCCISGSG